MTEGYEICLFQVIYTVTVRVMKLVYFNFQVIYTVTEGYEICLFQPIYTVTVRVINFVYFRLYIL